jgi:hypothetical protein
MLNITRHAVDRFVEHWREGMDRRAAVASLEVLVARSIATPCRTKKGDAWVYMTQSELGEWIPLAVRDEAVVTVLDRRAGASMDGPRMYAEHHASLRAIEEQRTRLAAWVETERAEQDRLKAAQIVAAWKAGHSVRSKALRRAKRLLEMAE